MTDQSLKDYKEVHKQLLLSIKEEVLAATVYRRRANYARAAGFHNVAELYEHVAKEEDHHSEEFLQAANTIKLKLL